MGMNTLWSVNLINDFACCHLPTTMPKLHQLDHKRAAYFNSLHEPCSVLYCRTLQHTGLAVNMWGPKWDAFGGLLFNPSIHYLLTTL